jgi:hypothetical protein
MGVGAVMNVPSVIKIGSDIQKLIGRIHTHTHTQQSIYFYFFKIRRVDERRVLITLLLLKFVHRF